MSFLCCTNHWRQNTHIIWGKRLCKTRTPNENDFADGQWDTWCEQVFPKVTNGSRVRLTKFTQQPPFAKQGGNDPQTSGVSVKPTWGMCEIAGWQEWWGTLLLPTPMPVPKLPGSGGRQDSARTTGPSGPRRSTCTRLMLTDVHGSMAGAHQAPPVMFPCSTGTQYIKGTSRKDAEGLVIRNCSDRTSSNSFKLKKGWFRLGRNSLLWVQWDTGKVA